MEKRVFFRSSWLPYLLVAPQIAITLIFFFWPAMRMLWFAFLRQDAFGMRSEFAGLDNFRDLLADSNYLQSFQVTALFSILALISDLALFAVSVAMVIPLLAAGSRRLHDRGQSGWLQMLLLVPCGSIVLIVFWILEGVPGPNLYGEPPA